jgi:hypothetical protein
MSSSPHSARSMRLMLDFLISGPAPVCELAQARRMPRFAQLALHVRSLPYRRTTRPDNPVAVLTEGCGTCSSKHQLLAVVAHQSGRLEVQLTVGIYEMSERNTPGVGKILAKHALRSIPEAHCYLRAPGKRLDFTGLPCGQSSPFGSLISEQSVLPVDLVSAKRELHMRALTTWAASQRITVPAAWRIRESCIGALMAGACNQAPFST